MDKLIAALGSFFRRNARLIRLLSYPVIFVFIAAALIGGWDKVKDYQWQFRAGYAALALVIFAAYLVAQAALTTGIVRRMNITLPYPTGIIMFLQAALTRYVPGGVWPFASVAATGQSLQLPSSMLVVALVLKEMFAVWASACFALPLVFIRIPDQPLLGVLAALGLAASLALAPLILRPLVSRIVRWRRLTLDLAIERVTGFGGFLRGLLGFAAAQVLYLLAAGCFLLAVTDFAAPELIYGALAMNGAWLFGLIVLFAPQGMGAREAAMVFLLLPFVDAPVAIALTLSFRLMTTLVDLGVFLPLLIVASRRRAA